MNIVYEYHEGSQSARPQEIDTNSSKTVVYLRRNIQRVTRKDPMSEETVSLWAYEEAALTFEEFEIYKSEAAARLSVKISDDNLSVMEAIAESYEQSMITQENQLTIMGAIAELYELISEK